jgi:hypothetical protein
VEGGVLGEHGSCRMRVTQGVEGCVALGVACREVVALGRALAGEVRGEAHARVGADALEDDQEWVVVELEQRLLSWRAIFWGS